MKKSYKKLLLFQAFFLIIIILNSFILNVLVKYKLVFFLFLLLVIFKYFFGFEKDRHRYTKDVMFEVLIVIFASFLLYYLTGLFVGFVKVGNYYTYYGMNTFIIPTILSIILKEILRYNMLKKSEDYKFLIYSTTLFFIVIDLINYLNLLTFKSAYTTFMFIALNLLPVVCNNIVCTYLALKTGFKVNIVWLIIIKLYYYLLPIIPNYNDYTISIIRIIFPLLIGYRIYLFYEKDNIKDNIITHNKFYSIPLILFISVLVYFSSGYFKYNSYAIGSGSMTPNINIGDVVIIDKTSSIKEGDVIAYKYNDSIIIHRLVKILEINKETYYYCKGDANDDVDNYTINNDMIVGKVVLTIPIIGKPAVWLSRL